MPSCSGASRCRRAVSDSKLPTRSMSSANSSIPPERKTFIPFPDERQCVVKLRKLRRVKKGVLGNKAAAHGKIVFGRFVVLLKVISLMNASPIPVPPPHDKLHAPLRRMACQHRVAKVGKDSIVPDRTARLELRRLL